MAIGRWPPHVKLARRPSRAGPAIITWLTDWFGEAQKIMTPEQIQEIRDTWEGAVVPPEHFLYRTVGEPSLTLAKDDILSLLTEVQRLRGIQASARVRIIELYQLTEETP